jgi:hypothetical protein
VACETCGSDTTFVFTKRCHNCREVEARLAIYLRVGGEKARAFIHNVMVMAEDPGDD